jgi:hypothetical protein
MNTLRQILIFFSLLISLNGYSQVSNYTFAQSSGTYSAIVGGTNYNNFTNWANTSYIGTLPNATAGFLDDNVSSALLPIGFNFVYNGTTFTQFGICTNGWISLGGLPTNSYTPLSTGTSNNVISAMGADLIGRGAFLANRTLGSTVITITTGNISQISIGDKVSGTGIPAGATVTAKTATTVTISAAATTTGTGFHFRFSNTNFGIRYQTIGTAPNRTLVVQWTGWQRYTTTGGFGELYNFQIRLNETTNTINVVYSILGPTSTTATIFQVGLRGSANTDFNNRTSTTTWSATTAGTLNSSTMTLSSTVKPTSGQTYTWTPPSCVAPTALTSSLVTTTSATISWTAASPIPSNGYQYYLSTSSVAPTAGTTPTGTTTSTSVNLNSLTPNTTYYFWVRSNCGGTQSTWAGSSTFFTGTPACTNISAFGTATAGTTNTPVTISTCNFQSEYSTVSGIVLGNTYSFGYSLGGYITIRIGTSNGTVAVAGNAPVSWTATSSGTVYVHYNTNSACGTLSSCGTSTVTCTSCTTPPSGCTNINSFGLVTAPTTNTPITISSCVFQSEHSQIDGVVSGSAYQFGIDCGGYITIRSGSYNGTVVAMGNAPLSWTSTLSGTIYVHYNTDSGCGTASVCCTNTITCTSCTTPIVNDLVCNAIPITCGSNTNGTTIGATLSGTYETGTCGTSISQPGVWYSVVGNGQVMTASLCATIWDSKISVFQGTCTSLTCLGGVDDNGPGCTGTSASYSWNSVSGTTYYILVHGFSTTSAFSINLTCTTPPPSDPTSISVSSSFVCDGSGTNVTLTANGGVGTVYWFNGSCGTTGQIGTGNSIVVNPTSTTTYYARNFNSGLFSTNCVNTTIQVINPPSIIAGSNVTICDGNNTQFNATTSASNTLTVLTGGTNGCTGGNMFDITVGTKPITITSFDVTPDITGTQTVNVYYKTGTYSGFETNSTAWTLLGSYSITGTADVMLNMPITLLPLLSNTTYGIYLNYNSAYTTGATTVSNSDISLSAGVGLCGQFSLINTPRTFNGKVNYEITPTLSWTPSSTLNLNNIINPIATPTSTTTYTLTGNYQGCLSSSNLTVTVNTLSTTPTVSTIPGRICPNTNTTLTASGGVAGTGSSIKWYSGSNGSGTLLATGSSLTLPYNTNTTIYVRREGTCNNTPDSISTINVRQFMPITTTSSITPNYCVDNDGWGHWYNTNDEIIFSAKGDFTMCNTGYPNVTINKTNTFYNQTQQPTFVCLQNQSPGEMRFEMGRNWNVDMGGATPSGLYSIRFYFVSSEKTDVINAANDTMTNLSNCGYSYKYTTPNGWFWFKNQGSTYIAPQWDGVQYDGLSGLTSNNVTYVEMDSIQGFSGGSGGVILVPNSILPIKWKSFNGETDNEINYLRWVTETETNTDYFEVERSQDGINFESISLVKASKNSLTDKIYNYTDETPYIGQNYYRIKLYNLDGSVEYSNIIVLNISKNDNYQIYPNPFDNTITYSYNNTRPEIINIEIINLLGQSIYNKIETSTNKLVINLNDLIPGFYKIKIKHLDRGYSIEEFIIKK